VRSLKARTKEILLEAAWTRLRQGYLLYHAQKQFLKRYYERWKYTGNTVACPFCERTFSKFRPTGALQRPFWKSAEGQALLKLDYINVANAMCPECRSGERHRLFYFYLRDRRRIFDLHGIRLLDVAPDDFLWNKVFSKADIEYISIDIRPGRRPTMLMDLTRLSFPDNCFDAIICYHVLEHIPEDVQAMRELYRVLTPGGWAILQVPIWAERTVEDPSTPRKDYAAVYGHPDHVRRYGLDYKDRLASVGFSVTVDGYARQLPREFIQRYGLFETEDIYLCEKPR